MRTRLAEARGFEPASGTNYRYPRFQLFPNDGAADSIIRSIFFASSIPCCPGNHFEESSAVAIPLAIRSVALFETVSPRCA